MSTSSLQTVVESLGTLFNGYVQVLISTFLPIFLGIIIIVGVVGLVVWGLSRLFRHKK